MKKWKRGIAAVLLLCMVLSLLPPGAPAKAAANVSYVLDTNGIDAGDQYLIVSAKSGNAYALKAASGNAGREAVTVQSDGTIASFSAENDCLWSFSAISNGTVKCGSYYLKLATNSATCTTSSNTLQFHHFGSGQYGIYISSSGIISSMTHLYYNNNSWTGNRQFFGSGTDADDYDGFVYLFKRVVETTYSVNYNGNGHTTGTLPQAGEDLQKNASYTVQAPVEELRKETEDEIYLFRCWNTKADGTGTEYAPGESLTVTEDTVLYAQWYLLIRYRTVVYTYLDGALTDKEQIIGENVTVCISPDEGQTFLELEETAPGTYSAYVLENGTYTVWLKLEDGTYEDAHGHKIVIYNQSGTTEMLHYSVSYDLDGGAWQDAAQESANYYINARVVATESVPVRQGYTFLGWQDQNGKQIAPGGVIAEQLTEKTVLTAQWEKQVNVTVNLQLDHKPAEGGMNLADDMHQVYLQLLQQKDGASLLVQELTLDEEFVQWSYNPDTGLTTYTYTFENLPKGEYNVVAYKSGYEEILRSAEEADGLQTITLGLKFNPGNFDLNFRVKVELDEQTKELRPQAVNVKVLFWNGEKWAVITQQDGENGLPVTVAIDENGEGSGFFPVWKYWANQQEPYAYRVMVSSFVMPDGSTVHASGDNVTYTADGSGLYTATVSVQPDGAGEIPDYPQTDAAGLEGVYYHESAENQQTGIPTVQVQVTPFTVTFDAGTGMLGDTNQVVLTNQYKYPRLSDYVPEPPDMEHKFDKWLVNGEPAQDLQGAYLPGDVTYVAQYSERIWMQGDVLVDATYQQDDQTVWVHDIDRVEQVLVVLQKNENGVFNDVESQLVEITYQGEHGTGSYNFSILPQDNVTYRVQVLIYNYVTQYNNNGNEADGQPEYTEEESDFVLNDAGEGQVDIHMLFQPESYNQWFKIKTNRLGATFRPDTVLAQILYRDMGDIHNFKIISQHTVDPYGVTTEIGENGVGSGKEVVWNWHTTGSLYEYQLQIGKVYKDGVYAADGTAPDENAPFTVEYGRFANYQESNGSATNVLEATLIPKEYQIVFDLNLDGDSDETVRGLEHFRIDNGSADDYYAYIHTWSHADDFTAYPYRDGYVFDGWISDNEGVVVTDDGHVHVGDGVAQTVTLTATWIPLTGNAYTVRHLELNTDKVLHGAQAFDGVGGNVKAVEKVLQIEGYTYAGAMIDGTYYDKESNPQMTITSDPVKNLMVLYYLPDGSDGYTEQVESNLWLDKTAVLEDNGTYTVRMETFTKDNPVTTYIQQDTPLDIVLVLDQSGSIIQSGYLDDLQAAVNNFIELLSDHGRTNKVDHRIAMVGYAGDEDEAPTGTNTNDYPIAGGNTTNWVNTGVFDSNGDFHPYPVTGFNYTEFTGQPTKSGTYYAYSDGEYLLLTYHESYYHLLDKESGRIAYLNGETIYGYTDEFVELTRNSSGLWLYGDKQLYSKSEFFTFHTDVWTHRSGMDYRQIHAYGTGSNYVCTDGHGKLYTRTETQNANPQLSVYKDAMVPVSVGAFGSGDVNPGLTASTTHLGSNGGTFVQYGIDMANKIFAANPLDPDEGRVRIMVMFTDGLPGIGTFDETEANAAIEKAYITKNTHGAYSYTIGLYTSDGVDALSDQAMFMNAVSTNYPEAQSMDDVRGSGYEVAADGTRLSSNGGPYYVQVNGTYYEVSYSRWYGWRFTRNGSTTTVSSSSSPTVSGGKVGNYTIYVEKELSYAPTDNSGYYSTTDSEQELKDYFARVMQEITTKISTEIVLHSDTILRDIMGQGLVLTDGTVITVYTQKGNYQNGDIVWETKSGKPVLRQMAQLKLGEGATEAVGEEGVSIYAYNLDAQNPDDPQGENYHPHTVDITGYNFHEWYISDEHEEGYKMIVTIDRIEAKDSVQWGRATYTNNEQSGLWLPEDTFGNRELLLAFDQPSTIFVERAYVLDYGKEFTLSDWYFDSEDGKEAAAVHVDCDIESGMNWFNENDPNTASSADSAYGNTRYGNVRVEDGKVKYAPVTTQWGGYDQFYVFGDTWRKTVLAQDANENGNLWNKVTVIPANNVYYEDSFLTTEDSNVNGITGFTFTGAWETVSGGAEEGGNVEIPENQEKYPYGNVHGWSDSLDNDQKYTDGSAHATDTPGAAVEFTFTGTGVDVYTRTNDASGVVIATLYAQNGDQWVTQTGKIMDNLAVSGDYYSIPTINFHELVYGTYKVVIRAMKASDAATGSERTTYWVDGIRVYNPLGSTQNYNDTVVKQAYDLELNAVFTEVRDVLLDNGTFTEDGAGAVFIDWIREGQTSGSDQVGEGQITYEIGTFEDYGPKNEVYLSSGQAIVVKVDPTNYYYVGLKSLEGGALDVNVSGLDRADPTTIQVEHTTDLYYRVTPVDGYLVIQNGSDSGILSVTRLRATNLKAPPENGGLLPMTEAQALTVMQTFDLLLAQPEPEEPEQTPEITPVPPQLPAPEEGISAGALLLQQMDQLAKEFFTAVRVWLRK